MSFPTHVKNVGMSSALIPDGFPSPPPSRTGWPWDLVMPHENSKQTGSTFPKITMITPSFNQGGFIEETIRSVLLQGYRNLQYIIIDGGSTDETMAVVEKYRPWIDLVISERDSGQADAIQKGLSHASGDIFNWINSDDLLAPGALLTVGLNFGSADVFAGTVTNFGTDCQSEEIPNRALTAPGLVLFENNVSYHQPGCWLRCAPFKREFLLDTSLHYSFDYDMMIRYLSDHPKAVYTNQTLAYFRIHANSKTGGGNQPFEAERRVVWNRALLASEDRQYSKRIALQIERSLSTEQWRKTITSVSAQQRGRVARAVMLTVGMLQRPRFRLNRFTLGAIKQILR